MLVLTLILLTISALVSGSEVAFFSLTPKELQRMSQSSDSRDGLIVSLLSNLGKLFPVFFYRDRKLSERLALSIGMFTRGEVGAGVIFIALGYNLGGPVLIVSVLTIVLNLILTGGFVLLVKRLALKAYGTQPS